MKILLAKVCAVQFLLLCWLYPVVSSAVEYRFQDKIIIIGKWGDKLGEFGKESLGKTELGYVIDFTVYKNRIYILDTMNNRIQEFDLNGKFISAVPLSFDWLKQGVAWEFTLLRDHFFALVGKPPYYSFLDTEIYKITPHGKLLSKFGDKQLNKNKQEYFTNILASEKTGELYCGMGNSTKIAVYDFNGNFIKYLTDIKSAPGVIIDADGLIDKNVPRYCSWIDKNGNCYKIWSSAFAKNNFGLTTQIQIFPRKSKTKDMITYELSGDAKLAINNEMRSVKYRGNFMERSFVDKDGKIYHLIALDEGIVLRRIEWKPE